MWITPYQNPGWGSAIVAAQMAVPGLPVELVEVGDIYNDPAAITLYLAGMTGSDLLVPAGGAARG